jgi:hypothetical protein
MNPHEKYLKGESTHFKGYKKVLDKKKYEYKKLKSLGEKEQEMKYAKEAMSKILPDRFK